MTYATVLVHVELGCTNANLLRIAGDVAELFGAGVIGLGAAQPMPLTYSDGYLSGDLVEQDQGEIASEMDAAEAECRAALQGRAVSFDWRSTSGYLSLADQIAREARSADLVLTGVTSASLVDGTRRASTGDLVMQVGRPVLIVPPASDMARLERILLGWKDTREPRRAAVDALPLFKKAGHVSVVEIAAEEDLAEARMRLKDVAGWLRRHGVMAETFASTSHGEDSAHLRTMAREHEADIVVAGAYGHSRLREWALGGVTRDLLMRTESCSLLSH